MQEYYIEHVNELFDGSKYIFYNLIRSIRNAEELKAATGDCTRKRLAEYENCLYSIGRDGINTHTQVPRVRTNVRAHTVTAHYVYNGLGCVNVVLTGCSSFPSITIEHNTRSCTRRYYEYDMLSEFLLDLYGNDIAMANNAFIAINCFRNKISFKLKDVKSSLKLRVLQLVYSKVSESLTDFTKVYYPMYDEVLADEDFLTTHFVNMVAYHLSDNMFYNCKTFEFVDL